MLKFHESCIGLSFPAIGKYKIEIWYAPKHYKITPHAHPNQDISLFTIFAHDVCFYRRRNTDVEWRSAKSRWFYFLRKYTIRAGDFHFFSVSRWPLIFLNVETWKIKPTSAADDFDINFQQMELCLDVND